MCVLQMKCRLGLDELESTSGHLNHKVSAHDKQSLFSGKFWPCLN